MTQTNHTRIHNFKMNAPSKPIPSPLSTPFTPRGLSTRNIIIIAAALSGAALLTITLATIHCLRRRKSAAAEAQQRTDIENSLQRARPPVLAIDTSVPRVEMQRSVGSILALEDVHVSMRRPDTAPSDFMVPVRVEEVRSPVLGRRASRYAFVPGVGGRGGVDRGGLWAVIESG